jgi:hypothetical protein
MPLLTSVVGHTTITSTRILGVFEHTDRTARLVYQQGSDAPVVVDQPLRAAPPYGLATFVVRGLAGGTVTYALADYAAGAQAPDPAQLLATAGKRVRLQASPNTPPRIALVSCNDIDNHAFPKPQRSAMWRRLKALVDSGEVDLIVHAGDQIYGDGDPAGWSAAEGRTVAYRRHYVNTWSQPEVAAVLGSCPNVMMWDDHEIYDGYGSNDNDQTPAAATRYRAAAQAFEEFQTPLNPSDPVGGAGYGWVAKYGDLAIVAVDGRSQRRWATGTILGKPQLDALELRLHELAPLKLRHLLVVVGTPVVYIPILAAEKLAGIAGAEVLDDLRDGWTASKNREECRAFLMRLLNFAGQSPETMVTILGGDIHVGSLGQIDTRIGFGPQQRRPRLYQVTSSGVARPAPSGIAAFFLSLVANGGTQELFNQDIVGSLGRINGSDHAFCITHRNFAVLDPSDGQGGWDGFGNLTVTFHTEQPGQPALRQRLIKLS